MNLSLATRSGRWGLQNPQARIDQLLAVITAADDLIASGRPEAARGLLVPFRGSGEGSAQLPGLVEDWPCDDGRRGPQAHSGPVVGRVSANETGQEAPDSRAEPEEGPRTDAPGLGQASAKHRPSDHRADGRRT